MSYLELIIVRWVLTTSTPKCDASTINPWLIPMTDNISQHIPPDFPLFWPGVKEMHHWKSASMQWLYAYAVVFTDFHGVTKKNPRKTYKPTMLAGNITIKMLSGGVPPFVAWAEVSSEWYHTICSSAAPEKYIHHAWWWMIMTEHSMADYIFNTQSRAVSIKYQEAILPIYELVIIKVKQLWDHLIFITEIPTTRKAVFFMKQGPASHLELILTLDSGIVIAKTFWQTNSPVTRGIIKHSKRYLTSFKHGIVVVSLLNHWLLGDVVMIEKCNFWIYVTD